MPIVLGVVLLLSITIMSWPSISRLIWPEDAESPQPLSPVVVDKHEIEKERENNYFKEIDDKINALEKLSWNNSLYQDIMVNIDTKYSMALLNEKQKLLLIDKLELVNIKMLKVAITIFFNTAKQTSELTSIRTSAMTYSKGKYLPNAQDVVKAINDFDKLTSLEKKATSFTAANFTEDEINGYFTSIESLEKQPYLNGSVIVQRVAKAAKNSLGEILANMKIGAIRSPINDYVTEQRYDENTTNGYMGKISEMRSNLRISGINIVQEFCRVAQSDLNTHKSRHERLDNWVKTRSDEACEDLFGKFQYYVRACKQMRGDTLPPPPQKD